MQPVAVCLREFSIRKQSKRADLRTALYRAEQLDARPLVSEARPIRAEAYEEAGAAHAD